MLDEKLTNIDVASMRRQMQRSVRPKQRKGENDGSKPGDAPAFSSAGARARDVRDIGIHVSFLLDEKMTNIEMALYRRPMQGSESPKQKNRMKLWREK
jgi:hypothetical protein